MRRLLGFSFLVLSAVAYGQERPSEEPVRVSSGTMAGQVLTRPSPSMTSWESALFFGMRGSGSVSAKVTISETGHVEDVALIRGTPGLSDAVLRAYRGTVYRPYLLNGKPVRVTTKFTMSLSFGRPDPPEVSRAIGIYVPPTHWPDSLCDSPWAKEGEFHKQLADGAMSGSVVSQVDPVRPPGEGPGSVLLKVCVAADGRVEKAQAVSRPSGLGKPAEDALLQWRYKPYLVDGVAVPVMTTVWVKFR